MGGKRIEEGEYRALSIDSADITELIDAWGIEGFGIYTMLVEVCFNNGGSAIAYDSLPALARKYNTTAYKVQAVAANSKLFESIGAYFYPSIKSITE